MDSRSNFGAARILCVEFDVGLLESRCAVLKHSGYDAASASPKVAEIMLRSRKFDLIVISRLSDFDLHRVVNLADSADVLVLEALTRPSKLLSLLAKRLDQHAANDKGSTEAE
jgi:DNA-binding response OmpR family regulator